MNVAVRRAVGVSRPILELAMIEMRTFPGLFVGRRTVLLAEEAPRDGEGSAFGCGACRAELIRADRAFLNDVVVKCRCGEFNQL